MKSAVEATDRRDIQYRELIVDIEMFRSSLNGFFTIERKN